MVHISHDIRAKLSLSKLVIVVPFETAVLKLHGSMYRSESVMACCLGLTVFTLPIIVEYITW